VEEMNKAELVSRIAELAGVTKVQAEKGLDALIQAITEANRSSRERSSCKTCRIWLI
jgi:nucleoid DNA-binding protein